MADLVLQFGEYRLDEAAGALLHKGVPVRIQPKPLALLLHLARHRERVVSKRELLEAVWPDVSVSDLALFSALRDLRRTLGDTDTAERTVRTIRGQGFQFVAQVTSDAMKAPPARASYPELRGGDFVGRTAAMTSLMTSLSQARRGKLRVSFIAGAAGIGKTRLMAELMNEAARKDVEAQLGRCIDREGATAFWPWLELIRGLIGSERTGATAHEVCRSVAELAPLAELSRPVRLIEQEDLDRVEARLRFFDAVRLLLERVSRERALLLAIDDLHWSDEASLLLLDHLLSALHAAPIHVVAAFRDPPRPERTLARVLATGTRLSHSERIDLEGLGHEAVTHLLASATDEVPARELVDAVMAATSGNALFVSELAKLAAQGELEVTRSPEGLPVPRRVRDVLRWQLDRLSPSCQRVLQALSVVGGPLSLAALSRAVDDTADIVLDSISEAEAHGLVIALPEPDARFAFVHDLVRESIYRDLSTAARTRLHRRMAQALEAMMRARSTQGPNDDVSQIAYHYALGAADGAAESAVRFCYLAGQQANARMAYEGAVEHYERALRALPAVSDPSAKLSCEIMLAQAEAAWGTSEDAASVQRRFVLAADTARAAGERELFARAALGRSGHGVGPGDFREVLAIDEVDIALLTEAMGLLSAEQSELRALVLARLALAVRYAKPFEVADELSARAVEMAEAINAPAGVLAEVLRYRHEVLSGPEHARARLELAARILQLAREVRSRPLEIDALTFQTRTCFETLDFAGSYAAVVAVDALEAPMKHPGMHFRNGIRRVSIAMLVGALDKAEQLARQFYERDAARNIGAGGTFELQCYRLAALRGDHQTALAVLDAIVRRQANLAWADCAIARELALSGSEAGARMRLDALASDDFRAITHRHELATLASYYLLAETCAALADQARARVLYERVLPFEGMMAAPFLSAVWQGSMAHALGLLVGVLRQLPAAEQHFERAREIAKRAGSTPLLADADYRLGEVLLTLGGPTERPRGLELLAQAVEAAERIGMHGIVRACRELLGNHDRGSVPQSPELH